MTRHKARPDKIPSRHKIRMKTTVRCLCGPGKVFSPSRSQAKKLFKRIDRLAHNEEQVWFYQCEHGGWHWTRMAPHKWPGRHKRDTP